MHKLVTFSLLCPTFLWPLVNETYSYLIKVITTTHKYKII